MIKSQLISTPNFLPLLQQFLFSLSSSSPDSKSMVGQHQHENQQEDQQDVEFQEMGFNNNGVHVHWVIMEPQNQNNTSESESVSSIGEDSGNNSGASTSSSELEEDASSSSSSTEFGPLYELSDIMNQLPIKRGLSKNYQGKSQSFTSLANVKSLEDLAKKVRPYSHRMKSCKSYAGGLDAHKFGPKATIAKKRGSSSSPSSFASLRKGNLVGSFIRPVCLQQRDY